MKWFKKNLKPSWTFQNGFNIWRLLPSTRTEHSTGGVLVVELRDTQKKTTEFACLDLNTGTLLWKDNPLDDKWWITVNKINKDVLFLQQFARPDMPTPDKIFALDLLTGRLLWQNQEVSFINISGESLYGLLRTFKSEEVVELNYRTGEEKERFSVNDPRVAEISQEGYDAIHGTGKDEFIVPDFIEAEADLRTVFPPGAVNPAVIKLSNPSSGTSSREIVGYYLDAGKDDRGIPVYDACIAIIDARRKIFEDVADRKVYSTAHDLFFVVSEKVIYVKNSTEIVAVAI